MVHSSVIRLPAVVLLVLLVVIAPSAALSLHHQSSTTSAPSTSPIKWHVNVSHAGGGAITAGIAAIAPSAVASSSPALLALITQDSNVAGSGTLWLVDAATGHIDVGSAVNISVAVPENCQWQQWSITLCDGENSVCVAGFSAQATRYRIVSYATGTYRFQLAWTFTLPITVGMAPTLLPGYDGQAEEALAFVHGALVSDSMLLLGSKSGKLLWSTSISTGIYTFGATVDKILINSVTYPEVRVPIPLYTTTLVHRGNGSTIATSAEQLGLILGAKGDFYATLLVGSLTLLEAWPNHGWDVLLPFPNDGGVQLSSLLVPPANNNNTTNSSGGAGVYVACSVSFEFDPTCFNISCVSVDLATGVTVWTMAPFQVPTDPQEGASWGQDLTLCAGGRAACLVITPQNDPATLVWIDLKTGRVNPGASVTLGRKGNGGPLQPVTAVGVLASGTNTVGTVALTVDSVYGLEEPTSRQP